jgi:hypothetical protein
MRRALRARRTLRHLGCGLGVLALSAAVLSTPGAAFAESPRCPNGRSKDSAMWLSVAHPGLGEWFLKGWGSFAIHAPQKKFWLGFIPLYGWPGYLQVKSARDARHCRTNDELHWND